MKSASAYTAEILDTEEAIRDLAAQVRAQLPHIGKGIGILFASLLYDWEEFLPGLAAELGIEVVGSTGVALLTPQGYKSEGATLLVLSGDDCVHGTAVSLPQKNEAEDAVSMEEAARSAYDAARARLGDAEPRLALFFSTPQVARTDIYLDALVRHTGGTVPFLGGLASDLFKFDTARVIAGGAVHEDRFCLVLLGGDFKPLFEVGTVVTDQLDLATVTRSEGYVVKEIDGRPAVEFLQKNNVMITTQTSKQFCPICSKARDGVTIVPRDIRAVDATTGEITLFGDLPEGTRIFVQSVGHTDLEKSAVRCIDALLARLAALGNDAPHCILGVSCAGRMLVLGPYKDVEGRLLCDKLPPHISFGGFYAFGEICPMGTEKLQTFGDQPLLNLSFALCAL